MREPGFVSGFAWLCVFLLGGTAAQYLTGWPIPGPVWGMAALTGALGMSWLRLEQVEAAADGLLRYLGLLFVPPGVGVMEHFGLIASEWPAIVAAWLGSTFLVLGVTGLLAQRLGDAKP